MANNDLRTSISDRLERLNATIAKNSEAHNEVRRLKAEAASLTVKLAADEGNIRAGDFAHLVHVALDSW